MCKLDLSASCPRWQIRGAVNHTDTLVTLWALQPQLHSCAQLSDTDSAKSRTRQQLALRFIRCKPASLLECVTVVRSREISCGYGSRVWSS
jgi:hypothetical protein